MPHADISWGGRKLQSFCSEPLQSEWYQLEGRSPHTMIVEEGGMGRREWWLLCQPDSPWSTVRGFCQMVTSTSVTVKGSHVALERRTNAQKEMELQWIKTQLRYWDDLSATMTGNPTSKCSGLAKAIMPVGYSPWIKRQDRQKHDKKQRRKG